MDKVSKSFIFKSIGLAMGIATLVLSILKTIDSKSSIALLSMGLICLAISDLEKKEN